MLIAVIDPTSRGEGGAARLRHSGIDVHTHVLEKEALVVLGPWLAALSRRRPVLHLLIQTDAAGNATALSAEALTEIEIERQGHDLLISVDGSVEEGRTGSHGRGFSVPTVAKSHEPEGALAVFAEAGARTVLLAGLSNLGKQLLSTSLIDRLTLLMPAPEPSQSTTTPPAPLLPDGYVLSRIARTGSQLLVRAERC
ncbi:hypothetical protein [Streptomyces sp. NBC_01411]|uniref:hypothetical protein n=1 Tax=Streptomyces sp. NBC_01411 TaxID=2903857 RepID=UPI00386C4BA1